MNKLRLDVDTLQVEAFETVAAPAERGTVAGRAFTLGSVPPTCCCTLADKTCLVEDCTA